MKQEKLSVWENLVYALVWVITKLFAISSQAEQQIIKMFHLSDEVICRLTLSRQTVEKLLCEGRYGLLPLANHDLGLFACLIRAVEKNIGDIDYFIAFTKACKTYGLCQQQFEYLVEHHLPVAEKMVKCDYEVFNSMSAPADLEGELKNNFCQLMVKILDDCSCKVHKGCNNVGPWPERILEKYFFDNIDKFESQDEAIKKNITMAFQTLLWRAYDFTKYICSIRKSAPTLYELLTTVYIDRVTSKERKPLIYKYLEALLPDILSSEGDNLDPRILDLDKRWRNFAELPGILSEVPIQKIFLTHLKLNLLNFRFVRSKFLVVCARTGEIIYLCWKWLQNLKQDKYLATRPIIDVGWYKRDVSDATKELYLKFACVATADDLRVINGDNTAYRDGEHAFYKGLTGYFLHNYLFNCCPFGDYEQRLAQVKCWAKKFAPYYTADDSPSSKEWKKFAEKHALSA